jgi:serine/threonine protein kinase
MLIQISEGGMSPERRQQIEDLVSRALEREPAARARFMAEACGGDEELRRQVESLLAQKDASGAVTRDMLMPGAQLGSYRIETTLGQGGMGVVYRALDTKLKRLVAIKFLSDELADATARRRFQREAQMASSLNHPHIVTVHDAGEFGNRQYLVTEFVDGGTLRDWAKAEKRTWRQIVELLVGVADGLAAAHGAGILHRDIKPANILVAKNGYAKLADFGLSKLAEEAKPNAATQTLAAEPTLPGMVMGTIPYMAPEQFTGGPVDARSDIFSFGAVLYELLAGRRPFENGARVATPPLGPEVPPGLRIVVEKALENEPSERYQSMRELGVDLRRLSRQSGEDMARRAARTSGRWRWTGAVLLPVLLSAVFFGWQGWRSQENPEPLQAVPLSTQPGVHRYPTFSPDGNHVAYTWNGPKQDNQDIYIQQIGAGSPLRLTTDPKSDYNPVWSPDGRWIAFLRSQPDSGKSELRLIAPLGGPERTVTEIRVREVFVTAPYLTWCPDSNCLVVTDSPGEGQPVALFAVSLETGKKTPLTRPQAPVAGDAHPAIAPDGRWLVFRRNASGMYTGELHLLPLGTGMVPAGEPRRLTPGTLDASYPTWIPGSREALFSAKGRLWRLNVLAEGTPARLPFVGEDGIMPAVSRMQPGRPSRLVYVRAFQDVNIWRVETSAPGVKASSLPVIAVSSTRLDDMPQLSPDGRRVAFASDRSGGGAIWLADPDGSNAVELAFMDAFATGYPHWSPDGRLIVFHSNRRGQGDVYVVPATGGKPQNLTSHPARDSYPSFSRDGKWIYFASNRTGEDRVWKIPAVGGAAVQVTQSSGHMPLESPDGAYLYYVENSFSPSPLWRIPANGGAPEKVVEGVVLGNFAVLEGGIYYIDRPSGEAGIYWVDRPAGETRLQYFDFATRRSTTVVRNLGNVDTPLTVSADGRTILFPRWDSSVDDVVLVENFR